MLILKIKTENDELILKAGKSCFSVNDSKESYIYESFDSGLINGNISIDTIKLLDKIENMGFEFLVQQCWLDYLCHPMQKIQVMRH